MTSCSLSVLIPLFNEEEYVGELLARVLAAPLPDGFTLEVIVVDDGSKDGSVEVVRNFIATHPDRTIHLIQHPQNRGKGAAIQTAIQAATGHFSIIQDADLEYDPRDYPRLLAPLVEGRADVVYGSRFLISGERRVLFFWHSLANHFLTTLANMAANLNLTDMETCYKAFRTSFARSVPIRNNRFGIEPEITIKFARRRARFYETPISYHGRTYEQGKKVGVRDAFEAVWVILKARFTPDIYTDSAHAVLDAQAFTPHFNHWLADTILPFITDNDGTVLEIGAGTGSITRYLCPRRPHYIATDAREEYIEQLRNEFSHRKSVEVLPLDPAGRAEWLPAGRHVDTVVCLNVLEHIEDDAAALESMGRALLPGGRAIILVPNDPSAYGTLDKAIGHYRRYTCSQIETLLSHTGFEVEQTIEFNRVSLPAWRFSGQVLKATHISRISLRIFNELVWLWRKIDSSLPWQAASIIVIARRRA
jgi:SAM-dependent methyltransferase